MNLKRLGRVAFMVRDMDKTVDFFAKNFGMRFTRLDPVIAKRNGADCCYCHEMQLELVSPILPLPPDAPPPLKLNVEKLREREMFFIGLIYDVDDPDETVRNLTERNIAVVHRFLPSHDYVSLDMDNFHQIVTSERDTLGIHMAFGHFDAHRHCGPAGNLLAMVHARTSVRQYLPAPVAPELLETIVRTGMAAPSAGNRRPWAFITVTKKETLEALAAGLQYGKMLAHAPAAIVVCGLLDKSLPGEERDFWVQDCSAATQNILLAAEAVGLGAVWVGVHPMKERVDAVRKTLGIADNAVPLNVIPLGYPAGGEKAKDKFESDRIHTERW